MVYFVIIPLWLVTSFLSLLDKNDFEYFIGGDGKDAEVASFFIYDVSLASSRISLQMEEDAHDQAASSSTDKNFRKGSLLRNVKKLPRQFTVATGMHKLDFEESMKRAKSKKSMRRGSTELEKTLLSPDNNAFLSLVERYKSNSTFIRETEQAHPMSSFKKSYLLP